jgi:hypothetical protein
VGVRCCIRDEPAGVSGDGFAQDEEVIHALEAN